MSITTLAAPQLQATITETALDAAHRMAAELGERAAEFERLGTLPSDVVSRLRAAGLFRILQPRALGGLELAPAEAIRVVQELTRAEASAGWTVLIGAGGNAFTGWLEPAVARQALGADADVTIATVFAPTGRITEEGPAAVRLSGRWPFASGCRHAEWFLNGAFVFDGDTPRMLPGRGPDWRLALFPAGEGHIIDDWDVIGLQGTGSNDVAADGVRVPAEHLISPFYEPARHDGPLWRLPFFTLAGLALVGFPLGVGRRALDELTAIAPAKARAGGDGVLANDPTAQLELALAEGKLQSAEAFVYDAVGSIWDTACAGDVPSVEQRARLQLAGYQAMLAAVSVVDTGYAMVGAGAIRAGHPLQRCFRDVHAAAQHAYFSPAAPRRYAKARLGIDQPLLML